MLLGEVLAEGQGACRRVEPSQALPSSENYLEATAESFLKIHLKIHQGHATFGLGGSWPRDTLIV